jgi:hypothetical protein
MTAGHRVSRASTAGWLCAAGLPRRFVRTRPTNVGSRAAGCSSRVRDRTVLACGCGLNDQKPHDRILSHSPRSRGTSRTCPHDLGSWGTKIIGYGQNGPPVLVTGGKKTIGYVRPPPLPAAESQSLHHTRGRPRPPQPAVTDVTGSCGQDGQDVQDERCVSCGTGAGASRRRAARGPPSACRRTLARRLNRSAPLALTPLSSWGSISVSRVYSRNSFGTYPRSGPTHHMTFPRDPSPADTMHAHLSPERNNRSHSSCCLIGRCIVTLVVWFPHGELLSVTFSSSKFALPPERVRPAAPEICSPFPEINSENLPRSFAINSTPDVGKKIGTSISSHGIMGPKVAHPPKSKPLPGRPVRPPCLSTASSQSIHTGPLKRK